MVKIGEGADHFSTGLVIVCFGANKRWCTGKLCVEATPTSKVAWISEELCIGCGICVKASCSFLA